MRVEEVCSQRVFHVPSSSTLRDAAVLMRDHQVGTLLVTEPGGNQDHVAGVVTDRDIVLHGVAASTVWGNSRVEAVMSHGVIVIDRGASISDALRLMLTHGIRRLVVLKDKQAIFGILSMDDAIRALGTDWALLAGILQREREHEAAVDTQTPLSL